MLAWFLKTGSRASAASFQSQSNGKFSCSISYYIILSYLCCHCSFHFVIFAEDIRLIIHKNHDLFYCFLSKMKSLALSHTLLVLLILVIVCLSQKLCFWFTTYESLKCNRVLLLLFKHHLVLTRLLYLSLTILYTLCLTQCFNHSCAVDGDPHFMIELPERDDALCFNINDKPGTIFNLVRDPKSGQQWVFLKDHTSFFFKRGNTIKPVILFRLCGEWPNYWQEESGSWW